MSSSPMLNLIALKKVVSSVLSPPRLHTALLFTPSGTIVAHATDTATRSKDQLRILIGLASEVWLEVSNDDMVMVESELGKILVLPLYLCPSSKAARSGRSPSRPQSADSTPSASDTHAPLLIALNALDDVEWAEMQIKAQGIVNYLAGPFIEFGDRLQPSPPRNRIPERYY